MKARLPQGYGKVDRSALVQQYQKMQEDMLAFSSLTASARISAPPRNGPHSVRPPSTACFILKASPPVSPLVLRSPGWVPGAMHSAIT